MSRRRVLFSGPHQRRQEEKLGVVRVSFKAQVTCISWHMCALRGNEKRSAWECKSKDAPQTERNAIDAQNEGAAAQRTKNNTRKILWTRSAPRRSSQRLPRLAQSCARNAT